MTAFSYLDVCSGISAASVAFRGFGWRCAGYAEIDKFARGVLEYRHGAQPVDFDHRWADGQNSTPLFGDFTKIEAHHVGPIDLLVGGTPCQSFSVAGKRLGLDDPRGNLTLEFLALARRVRPIRIIWENVPGVLSDDGGRTFGTFLGLMGQLGYGWAYRVLDAQFIRVDGHERAVPQRRKRLFVVGCLGDAARAAAVLFDRESLRGDHPPRREARQGVAPTLSARTRGGGGLGTDFELDGGLIASDTIGGVSPAVTSKWAKGSGGPAGDECQNLVAHTLTTGTDPSAHLVVLPFDTTQITSPGNFSNPSPGDPMHPLAATGHPPEIAIQENAGAEKLTTGPGGKGFQEGIAYTLEARHHVQSVAFVQNSRDEVRLFGEDGQTVGALAAEPGMKQQCYIAYQWAVRKLTPRECERLMGFPDDFTLIPWRAKPAGNCPDGPRYKALGNSMATNVMRWIGHGLRDVEAVEQDG